MRAIKIHGQRVNCHICKKHKAVDRFYGVLVCKGCRRAMAYGVIITQLAPPSGVEVTIEPGVEE